MSGIATNRVRKLLNVFEARDQKNLAPMRAMISCGSGCSACCHLWIGVQYLEAYEALQYARRVGFDLDETEVRKQAERALGGNVTRQSWCPTRCVFLDEENKCGVYRARPLACRAHHVTSDPRQCADPHGTVSGVDNRHLAGQCGRAIQAEHVMLAIPPVVAALPVMLRLALDNEPVSSLGKSVGLVGLEGEISDEEADEVFIERSGGRPIV